MLQSFPAPVNTYPTKTVAGKTFAQLKIVNTIAATPFDETFENVKVNTKRNYVRLHNLPEFMKIKNKPIALVGGGPSLDDTLNKLKEFDVIVSCGSSHDYITTRGFKPTYAVLCDPDPITANYIKYPCKETNYLVSTGCHKSVFNALEGYNITLWHCNSESLLNRFSELGEEYHAIDGGCTVGLRSISIALMFGYSDINFFGFDSCVGVKEENGITYTKHHAYDFTDETKEFIGDLYDVKLGMNEDINKDRTFMCAGYQLAQISHFKSFYQNYGIFFKPTFHGDGALTDLMSIIDRETKRLNNSKEEIIDYKANLMELLNKCKPGAKI